MIHIEIGIGGTQAVGNRNEIKYIHLITFTVVDEIFKKIFFVRKFLMKLKMVQTMLKNFTVHTVIKIKSSRRLLPFEVKKEKFAVRNFLPVFPS